MSKTITSAEYNAWLEHPLTKGLKRSFQQSITDPENQPSQYGTVTLEMYEALEDQLAAAQEQQQTTFLQLSHALRITEEKLAKAEQLWQVAQGRCDGLEEKLAKAEQRVAEACAYLAHQHMDADIAADAINNGEWRKLVKEEM